MSYLRMSPGGYVATVLLCVLCAVVVSSQSAETGDLWEDRVQMQMSGLPAGMAGQAQVHQRCSPHSTPTPPMADDSSRCEISDLQRSGSDMRWSMRCAGDPPMRGQGEIRYQGRDAYTGQWTMVTGGRQITMRVEGHRIGECDATAQARQVADARRQAAAAQQQARDLNELQCRSAVDNLVAHALRPEQLHHCAAGDKQRFCARLQTPEGFALVGPRPNTATPYGSGSLDEGAEFCGLDPVQVAAPICEAAQRQENLDLLAKGCIARGYGRTLVLRECAGRNYSSPPAPKYAEFCSKVASQQAGHDAAGASPQGLGPGAATTASPTEQAIDKGRQLLKGLFGR